MVNGSLRTISGCSLFLLLLIVMMPDEFSSDFSASSRFVSRIGNPLGIAHVSVKRDPLQIPTVWTILSVQAVGPGAVGVVPR